MVAASTIASVLVLAAGLCFLLLQVNKEQHSASESNRVATPMMDLSQHNGPWPKCLKMDGDACCSLIEGYAKDIDCVVLSEDAIVEEKDFSKTRVRVFVDGDSLVTKIPDRG